ncbi:glucose-6-phosphate dehydrogenase assembly protein OpcA [Microlunatus panaciterrae]|uniref:Glucose-6-phosphate dehydrogenase assembly protein OpcA n=1 Tax=Microlunatus panaciterrae TaxID=400768 RepID=A0ABS2RMM0_9ACTN|nr:glucose-6-phosphate dehydrogenase assembly protein OpcA [Microlunatus panaciterrae]MBM7800249.1 glucose-6-phosphate dehydrogenase assembly protein OpcA [Microlunatus panaciterrae]
MIINLHDTNAAKISSALLSARRSAGSPAMGMVLTLIIVCGEDGFQEALKASTEAGREHPSRILLVVTAPSRTTSLDAEVRIGEGTPGEVVVIRMRGAVARHPASVIRALLLPDSPVVIWWPGKGPVDPASDDLAQLARRRITDAMGTARPRAALESTARNYAPGDNDLTWTRLTPWRALLAAALDQYPAKVSGAVVEAERNNASADLLAAWLQSRLKIEVNQVVSEGPGITAVRMTTAAGDIAITRPDGLLASYSVPGQPNRLVALKRRGVSELITEELRRMDPDDIFEQTLQALLRRRTRNSSTRKSATRSAATKSPAAKAAVRRAVEAQEPTRKAPATRKADSTKATATRATATKAGATKAGGTRAGAKKKSAAARTAKQG